MNIGKGSATFVINNVFHAYTWNYPNLLIKIFGLKCPILKIKGWFGMTLFRAKKLKC